MRCMWGGVAGEMHIAGGDEWQVMCVAGEGEVAGEVCLAGEEE